MCRSLPYHSEFSVHQSDQLSAILHFWRVQIGSTSNNMVLQSDNIQLLPLATTFDIILMYGCVEWQHTTAAPINNTMTL